MTILKLHKFLTLNTRGMNLPLRNLFVNIHLTTLLYIVVTSADANLFSILQSHYISTTIAATNANPFKCHEYYILLLVTAITITAFNLR
jgi:hypothetical protein